jgi:hypothetical protein
LAEPEVARTADEASNPLHLTLAEMSRMPEGSWGRV